MNRLFLSFLLVGISLGMLAVNNNEALAESAGEPGGPSGKPNPLNNVYFGEQHLHMVNSPDAIAISVKRRGRQVRVHLP
ncbi:MAG: hypothetical protein Q8R92_03910 [Deltaproteobacteria bacterium]|nr:hypothetical protein [Deltaproteobacteria bacterium]